MELLGRDKSWETNIINITGNYDLGYAGDMMLGTQRYMLSTSRPIEDRDTLTILLTHLPLHKEASVCFYSPYFGFHSDEDGRGVKEQNHPSYNTGTGILEGIYSMSGNPDAAGG